MEEYRKKLYEGSEFMMAPIADFLIQHGITPNQISLAGLGVNLLAALSILAGGFFIGGFLYLLAGLIDMFDGTVARRGGQITEFGGFLDSTFDRVSEGLVFAAIAYQFAASGRPGVAGVVVLALLGSFLVSYVRARAEAMGLIGKSGIASRFERLLLISAALMFGLVAEAMYLLVALTALTVGQRIWSTYWQLEERKTGKITPL